MSTPRTVLHGPSRSFPETDAHRRTVMDACQAHDIELHLGVAGSADVPADLVRNCVLIELHTDCLGEHTGEVTGSEGDNRIGFARWRLGDSSPSDLVELVVQPLTASSVIESARAMFESIGLQVAVCQDRTGRILDRLLRPYFNDALRALDEGIASASDLDKTVMLGLGYPEGPIALLERTGLSHHYDVTSAMFRAYGQPGFVPARRARIAAERRGFGD